MGLKLVFCLVYCINLWRDQTCLGNNYSLECLNDYLFTITCELNLSSKLPTQDGANFLEFTHDRDTFRCELKSQTFSWVCVLNLTLLLEYSFTDTDFFYVHFNSSLHDTNSLGVLTSSLFYEPVKHIRPVPPSSLQLLWEAEQAALHWLSGYSDDVPLVPDLIYQLSISSNNKVWNIHSTKTHVIVPVSSLTPNTNYTAKVRSEPSQTYYKGVWSQWGPAIHWTTRTTTKNSTVDTSVFPWPCLLLLLLLPIGFILYYLLKTCVSISSPVPFVGDFKYAEPLPTVEELLQQESSLKLESMAEDCNSGFQSSPVHWVFDFSNDVTGTPESPSMLHYSHESQISLGSWRQAFTAVEKKSMMCSVDYCTLSPPPTV